MRKNFYMVILSSLSLLLISSFSQASSIIDSTNIRENSETVSSLNKKKDASKIVEKLVQDLSLDLSKPIIEVGCNCLGNFTYSLAERGAKEIYVISPSEENLFLAKSNIPSKLQSNNKITFINDEFSKSKEINKVLKNKNTGFVLAINELQNWTSSKMESELNRIYKGLKKGGSVLFTIENPLANEFLTEEFFKKEYENENTIHSETKIYKDVSYLNNSVNRLFKKIQKYHPDLELLPSSLLHKSNKRLTLYPFEVRKKLNSKTAKVYQILFPENMKFILENSGFKNIKVGTLDGIKNTFYVTASKI